MSEYKFVWTEIVYPAAQWPWDQKACCPLFPMGRSPGSPQRSGRPVPWLRLSLYLERQCVWTPGNLAVLDFGLRSEGPGWVVLQHKWDRWPLWEQLETNECGQFVELNDILSVFSGIHRNHCYVVHILHNPPIKKKIPIVKTHTHPHTPPTPTHTHTHTPGGLP